MCLEVRSCPALHRPEILMQQRQHNVCGSYGSDHGKCGVGGLCHCGNDGGSERGYWKGREGEKGLVITIPHCNGRLGVKVRVSSWESALYYEKIERSFIRPNTHQLSLYPHSWIQIQAITGREVGTTYSSFHPHLRGLGSWVLWDPFTPPMLDIQPQSNLIISWFREFIHFMNVIRTWSLSKLLFGKFPESASDTSRPATILTHA